MDTTAECIVCTRQIECSQLKTHVGYHFDYKPYRCFYCDGKFHSIEFLQSHSLEYGHLPLKYEISRSRAAALLTNATASYSYERSRRRGRSASQETRLREICVDLWTEFYQDPEAASASGLPNVTFNLLALLDSHHDPDGLDGSAASDHHGEERPGSSTPGTVATSELRFDNSTPPEDPPAPNPILAAAHQVTTTKGGALPTSLSCMTCGDSPSDPKRGPVDHVMSHLSEKTEWTLYACTECSNFKTNFRKGMRRHFFNNRATHGELTDVDSCLVDLKDLWPEFHAQWILCFPNNIVEMAQFIAFATQRSDPEGTSRPVSPTGPADHKPADTATSATTTQPGHARCRACMGVVPITRKLDHTWRHITKEDNVMRYRCLLCQKLTSCNDIESHFRAVHPTARLPPRLGVDAIDRTETHEQLILHMWSYIWGEVYRKETCGSIPSNSLTMGKTAMMATKTGQQLQQAATPAVNGCGPVRAKGAGAIQAQAARLANSTAKLDQSKKGGDGMQVLEELVEPPMCSVCGALMNLSSSTTGYSLRSHVLEHVMADTQITLYVCRTCNAGFRSKKSAKMHLSRKACEEPLIPNLKFIEEPFKDCWTRCFPKIKCKFSMLFREDMAQSIPDNRSSPVLSTPSSNNSPHVSGNQTTTTATTGFGNSGLPTMVHPSRGGNSGVAPDSNPDTPTVSSRPKFLTDQATRVDSRKKKKKVNRFRLTMRPKRRTGVTVAEWRVATPSKPKVEKRECAICEGNQTFDDYAMHARWHMNTDPSIKFRCLLCGRFFSRNTPGKVHIRQTHKIPPKQRVNWSWVGATMEGMIRKCFPRGTSRFAQMRSNAGCLEEDAELPDSEKARKYFKCILCSMRAETKAEMRQHQLSIHSVPDPARKVHYTVKRAGDNSLDLNASINSGLSGEDVNDSLDEPSSSMPEVESIKVEMQSPENFEMEEGLPQCDVCGYEGTSAKNVKIHKFRAHGVRSSNDDGLSYPSGGHPPPPPPPEGGPPGEYTCDLCESTWRTLRSLNMHKSFSHPDQWTSRRKRPAIVSGSGNGQALFPEQDEKGLFLCDICGSGWVTVTSMKKHRVCHAAKKQPIMDGGQSSSGPSSAKRSRGSDSCGEIFKCNFCGVEMPSIRSLQRHKFSNHQDLLKECASYGVCLYCDMAFISKRTMMNHLRNMHRVFTPILGEHFRKSGEGSLALYDLSGMSGGDDSEGGEQARLGLSGSGEQASLAFGGALGLIDGGFASLRDDGASGSESDYTHAEEPGLVDPLSFIGTTTGNLIADSSSSSLLQNATTTTTESASALIFPKSLNSKSEKRARLQDLMSKKFAASSACTSTSSDSPPEAKFDPNNFKQEVPSEKHFRGFAGCRTPSPALELMVDHQGQESCSSEQCALCKEEGVTVNPSTPDDEVVHVWTHAAQRFPWLSPFNCVECGASFTTQETAADHAYESHGREGPGCVAVCVPGETPEYTVLAGECFGSPTGQDRTCAVCGVAVPPREVEDHVWDHAGLARVRCGYCPLVTTSVTAGRSHVAESHADKYVANEESLIIENFANNMTSGTGEQYATTQFRDMFIRAFS